MIVSSSQDDGGSSSGGHPSPYSMQQLLQLPSSGVVAPPVYPTSAESYMYSMITKRTMEMVDYQAEYLAIKNNNNNSTTVDDKMDVEHHHHNHHHHQLQHHLHHQHQQYHPDDVQSVKVEVASNGDRTPEPAIVEQQQQLIVSAPSVVVEMGPLNLSKDSVAPRAAGSSRRKGIACKLERPAAEPKSIPLDCSTESNKTDDAVIPPLQQQQPTKEEPMRVQPSQQQQPQQSLSSSSPLSTSSPEKDEETHMCHHCDIIFKENIMYSMHMGFHSFRDPFACNLCGEITADKFSFFAHIARVPHS